jgi:hypothetical protein
MVSLAQNYSAHASHSRLRENHSAPLEDDNQVLRLPKAPAKSTGQSLTVAVIAESY